ncbi:RHS repeat-associated core domain-containing protein [Pseudomonas sp. xss_2]|uniref:RHS repeat-associated core domain-containing protein n=1 Tax=Pseudomonas sp. xss_2 TaxID=3367215 RepID=UPI00370C3D29
MDGQRLPAHAKPRPAGSNDYLRAERTTHYLYERDTFVPLVQASYEQQIALLPEHSYDGAYDIDQDRVWQYQPQAPAFKALDWYQCDHLGTPLELTDQHGEIVWRADYHAWGQAQVRLSEAAQRRKLDTALRFQGQYLDVETGLHYNRYRYYDPQVGRFVSADPIGYAGGLNLYQYAPNPVEWVDRLGLSREKCSCSIFPDGSIGELRANGKKDAHHIIQDAAVRELPGYNTNHAPGAQLDGPSNKVGTSHYSATQVQRQAGGGTYGAERRIGYKALRAAGLSPQDARAEILRADGYFEEIGVSKSTVTRAVGNRRGVK